MNLASFLIQRLAEDEAVARAARNEQLTYARRPDYAKLGFDTGDLAERHNPARVLADVAAKRAIVEWHQNWPVLVEGPPQFEQSPGDDLNSMTMRMSRQMAWLTEREYRTRFGTEPPTAPMLRALASVYADHPDWRDEWR